jgi:predicted nuclease of restriction endonuclease-like RecB superfamily
MMAEIFISKNSDEETAESSTSNNIEEDVIELEFDNELDSSIPRRFYWEIQDALSSIKIEKALVYAVVEMGLGANLRIFQFY